MKRGNSILNHKSFNEYLQAIRECEIERVYCKHNMQHFMDVARLAYIKVLQENIPIDQEIIYGASLLHDIGKHKQYIEGIPHDEASSLLAAPILKDCGYTEEEIDLIVKMIRHHRGFKQLQENQSSEKFNQGMRLIQIFQEADKQSRMCFACKAVETCKWPAEKKNLKITS